MFLARLKSFKSFLMIAIVATIAIFATSGGVLAQEPQWPPRTPHYSNQSGLSRPSINNITPAYAAELALAMGVPWDDLLAADLVGSDPAGVGVSDSSLGTWFPTEGSTFAILSTGLAASATLPNDSDSLSGDLGGLKNDQGNDLVHLHLQLKVPSEINCASFDFAFYSEEFPEFVGSSFNDTFTTQLNNSSLSTGENNTVIAPGNFAFDSQNNIISVNTVFGYSLETGTTYDGVTPLLRAHTAVVPNATIDVYFSVQDLGDSNYDSAVFLDKFFWSKDPTCSSGALVDTDGDGLLDVWETNGLTVSVGGVDEFVDLPAMGADPNHKDIFVEADYMVGHQPIPSAIWVIVDAFNNAPINNPVGTNGIHLHVDYGPTAPLIWAPGNWGTLSQADELTEQINLGTCPSPYDYNWSAFDTIKNAHFTAGRAAVFHYNVWAHNLCAEFKSTSGISRNGAAFGSGASDFIVSLGSWTGGVGTGNEQAGTFMHELGHNLGLRHGGEDHTQWKPNYISVMNYAFQTRGLFIGGTGGYFDYSRYDFPDLNESNLNETSTGIGAPTTIGTYHFCGLNNMVADTDASSVDWNCDGDQTDTFFGLSYNINQGISTNNNSTLDTLTTQNDWVNLVYSGGAISQPGAIVILPATSEVVDITVEQDAQIPSFPPSSSLKIYLPLIVR